MFYNLIIIPVDVAQEPLEEGWKVGGVPFFPTVQQEKNIFVSNLDCLKQNFCIKVMNPGHFGPIPYRSGQFSLTIGASRFDTISVVNHFSPI